MPQQKWVRAPLVELFGVTRQNRFALGVGEWPIGDGLIRIGQHGVAKRHVVMNPITEFADEISAHDCTIKAAQRHTA